MVPPAEISIPSTSLCAPPDGGKPYTLYNITLRLPLRSFVVQKRYSDFAVLHSTLSSLVGAPPAPLPGKTWFKSTVSSPDLTEERRSQLERYLRAIAEPPDRRWRDTPVWRAFLNLPSGSTYNSAASAGGIDFERRSRDAAAAKTETMAGSLRKHGAASDAGSWLELHRELRDALHEARRSLARRDTLEGDANSTARIDAGTAARRALIKAQALFSGLNDGLRMLKDAGRLGDGELRRRRDLLATARIERDGLEKLSASMAAERRDGGSSSGVASRQGMPVSRDKAALMSAEKPRTRGRVLGAPLVETERTRELNNVGLLELQKKTMVEQDQSVEELAIIVRRQRQMGLEIQQEVDHQVQLLNQTEQDADRLYHKMNVANKQAKKLSG